MRSIVRATLGGALVIGAATSAAATPPWSQKDRTELAEAIAEAAAYDGLSAEEYDISPTPALTQDEAADGVALKLANDLHEGVRRSHDAAVWHIPLSPINYRLWLDQTLAQHRVREAFQTLRPDNPAYDALRAAYLTCVSPDRCATLKLNLDRWRRLPHDLGDRYLWVNTAAYRVDLVDGGTVIASRRAIVGKPGTPTPIFRAMVTGVTANPWWNVPCGIVDESVGKLVRTRPAEAAQRGYVATKGSDGHLVVRQRPGPDNALGRVKLEMPNPYSVYLHDTSDPSLFDRGQRDLSHGCVRTQDPVTLGETLLGKDGAATLDTALLTYTSKTIPLSPPIPVYIVYFTAEPDANGNISYLDDIYQRDTRAGAQQAASRSTDP